MLGWLLVFIATGAVWPTASEAKLYRFSRDVCIDGAECKGSSFEYGCSDTCRLICWGDVHPPLDYQPHTFEGVTPHSQGENMGYLVCHFSIDDDHDGKFQDWDTDVNPVRYELAVPDPEDIAEAENAGSANPFLEPEPGVPLQSSADRPETKRNICPPPVTPNPIAVATGNKFLREVDYSGAVRFVRYYNSVHPLPPPARIGPGWSHNYSAALHLLPGAGGPDVDVYALRADGRLETFSLDEPSGELRARNDDTLVLLPEPPGWVIAMSDGRREHYDESGRLSALEDVAGRLTTLEYDDAVIDGPLIGVTGPNGHALTLEYEAGRLKKLHDPSGQYVEYTYDDEEDDEDQEVSRPGNLIGVSYPGAEDPVARTEREYQYNNPTYPTNLTDVFNERAEHTLHVEYDGEGRATLSERAETETPGVGQERFTVVYTTDANGAPQSDVTDARGNTTSFVFTTDEGRLEPTDVDQPATTSSARSYDPRRRLDDATSPGGKVIDFEYDDHHITAIHQAPGTSLARSRSFEYLDDEHDLVKKRTEDGVTGPATRVTDVQYDGRQPKIVTVSGFAPDALGGGSVPVSRTVTSTYYHAPEVTYVVGRLHTVDGPRTDVSDVTTYEWYDCANGDACGQLWKLTNALGQVTQVLEYDTHARPKRIRDPNGVETEFGYDFRGRLRSVTRDPTPGVPGDERVTQLTWYPHGMVDKVILGDGSFIEHFYDAAEQLDFVDDSAGNRLDYGYDAAGNSTTERMLDPSGILRSEWLRGYDTRNRLERERSGAVSPGEETEWGFDPGGRLWTVTDPRGNPTTLQYDGLERLQYIIDATTEQTELGYDVADRLVRVKDPRGLETKYVYDDLGRLLSIDSADSGVVEYSLHDEAGNAHRSVDARGVVVEYDYDALGRLSDIDYPGTSDDVTFGYDAPEPGRYGVGRLTSVADGSGTTGYHYTPFGEVSQAVVTVEGTTHVLGYTYDGAGRLKSVTYPSGSTVTYLRGIDGRVTDVITEGPGTGPTTLASAVTWAPFGPLTGLTYGNGLHLTQSLDLSYRPNRLQVGASGAPNPTGEVLDLDYDLDAAGNVTLIADANTPVRTQDLTNGYDELNRLVSGSGEYGDLGYAYDAVGNRTSIAGVPNSGPYAPPSPDALREYAHDDAGRLIEVRIDGTSVATYRYNALGQRVRKTTAQDTTLYYYDLDGKLLVETDAAGTSAREYVWLEDRLLAIVEDPSSVTPTIGYVHADWLGTPRAVTNASGVEVWVAAYSPFGLASIDEDPDGDQQAFVLNVRFPGQYFDAESGLHYNYYRYYDPTIGRYLESDPIGIEGGPNSYLYGEANPLRYTDPFGLSALPAAVPVGEAAIAACLANPIVCAAIGSAAAFCLFYPDLCAEAVNSCIDGLAPWMADEKADAEREKSRAKGVSDRDIGPSGKPKRHEADHPTKKKAREAAEREGKGKPIHHPSPIRGRPHYHPTDAAGKKMKGKHHTYPR